METYRVQEKLDDVSCPLLSLACWWSKPLCSTYPVAVPTHQVRMLQAVNVISYVPEAIMRAQLLFILRTALWSGHCMPSTLIGGNLEAGRLSESSTVTRQVNDEAGIWTCISLACSWILKAVCLSAISTMSRSSCLTQCANWVSHSLQFAPKGVFHKHLGKAH